ncbi:hypothetical protein VCHA53O466_50193 [Vibrio chagasii]|nr:hypothetical protein VCHA53O466_50193 [Vibrio chagasii]
MHLVTQLKAPLGETPTSIGELRYTDIPCGIREAFMLELLLKANSESTLAKSQQLVSVYEFNVKRKPQINIQNVMSNVIAYCDAEENENKERLLEYVLDAYLVDEPELPKLIELYFQEFDGNKLKAQMFANLSQFGASVRAIAAMSLQPIEVCLLPPELTISGLDDFHRLTVDSPKTQAFHFPRMEKYSMTNERGFIYEKIKYITPQNFKLRRRGIHLPSPSKSIVFGTQYINDDRQRVMSYSFFELLSIKVKQGDTYSISWLLIRSVDTFHAYIDFDSLDYPLAAAANALKETDLSPLVALSDFEYRKLVSLCLSYGAIDSAVRLTLDGLNKGRDMQYLINVLDNEVVGELKYLNISQEMTDQEKTTTERLNSLSANVIGNVKLEPSHFRPLVNLHLGTLLNSKLFKVYFSQSSLEVIFDTIDEANSDLSRMANRLMLSNWCQLFDPLRSRESKDMLKCIFSYLLLDKTLQPDTDLKLNDAEITSSESCTYGSFVFEGTLFLTGSYLWDDVIDWLTKTDDEIHSIRILAIEKAELTHAEGRSSRCISDLTIQLGEHGKKLLPLVINSNTFDNFGARNLNWEFDDNIRQSIKARWNYINSKLPTKDDYQKSLYQND